MSETAPYRSLPEGVSLQDVVERLDASIDRVIDSGRTRMDELFDKSEGSREDVKRAIKNLRRRADLLTASVQNETDSENMAILEKYLITYTDGIEAAMPRVATSRLLLSKMIYRYGMGIQIQVDRLKLIDDETKNKLKEIDKEVLYLTEE